MTKEPPDLPHGSQTARITDRELMIELERLGTHFPRTDMTPVKWKLLAQDFWEDCRHLTLEHLRQLCRAYRQKPENRFFPSPGQLLNADRHPMDNVYIFPRRPVALPPPEPSAEEIERRAQVLQDLAKTLMANSVLAPCEVVMTPELIQRERDLAPERAATLERRLKNRSW